MSRRFSSRSARTSTAVVVLLLSAWVSVAVTTAAAAQGVIQVPQGSAFTVENGVECAPNNDVAVFFSSPAREARRVGSSISDGTGHFAVQVALPAGAALGAATVSVECGIADAVLLYDIEVVAATPFDPLEYAPRALGAIAVLALVSVVVLRRRGDDEPGDSDVQVVPAPPAPALIVPPDDEDDPEYWVWDAKTERGMVKRLACLSEASFFLHEVAADEFADLLDLIAVAGPEVALERAFFRVAVADIDEVRHRGTEMRVTYRGDDGFVSKTIDLATEVDDVIGLLSRRVPVMADGPPVPAA